MLEAQSEKLPRQVRFGPAFSLAEQGPLSFAWGFDPPEYLGTPPRGVPPASSWEVRISFALGHACLYN